MNRKKKKNKRNNILKNETNRDKQIHKYQKKGNLVHSIFQNSFSAWSVRLRQRSYKNSFAAGSVHLRQRSRKNSFTAESVHRSNGKRKENRKHMKGESKGKVKEEEKSFKHE
jgi:hypothetical protein